MAIEIGDATVAALRATLTRSSQRAGVVASNLANLDTPDYRSLEVAFDSVPPPAGRVEMRRTDPRHLAPPARDPARGRIVEAAATRVRNDGNTVDVDREMTLLAMLEGRYRAAAEMVRKRFALRIYAATEGRSG